MGFIANIVNKFKFKSVSDIYGTKNLSVGEYENGGLALLKDGKIVDEGLRWVNGSYLGTMPYSNEYILAETLEGDYRVYDKFGGVVAPSLKNPEQGDIVQVVKEDDVYIVDIMETGKFVVVPSRKIVTENYSFIDAADENGCRLVTKLNLFNDFQPSYYVDGNFSKISPEFIEEQDFGDFKILSVPEGKDTVDYICDPDYKCPSKKYSIIDCVNGRFFATNNENETFFIGRAGEVKTKPLSDYNVLSNGYVLAMEEGKTTAKLFDKDYDIVSLIEEPVVDESAGIIAGEVGGRYVMFGYDNKKLYEVDKNVARLMIDKLQGKRMLTQTLSFVLENQIDMTKTMKAYELIVAENLKTDPENGTLIDLSLNAREKFLQSIEKVTVDRVRRANARLAEMEEEKRRMEIEATRLQKRKGKASEYNTKVSELEED